MYRSGIYSLRGIEEDDLEWTRVLHNSPEVLYMLTDTRFVSKAQQRRWFDSVTAGGHSMRYVIELSGQRIGLARLDEIDLLNRSICVGLDICEEFRGKGHGYGSFRCLLRYCFAEMNMHRVWLLVAEFNEKALKLYEKLGFSHEGRQRDRLYRDGHYHDYLLMSILEPEFAGLLSVEE